MGAQRTSFGKRERDRTKKAKAAAKRERRQDKTVETDGELDETQAPVVYPDGELSAAELLDRIEAVHRRFDAGTISLEDFEEEKAELFARLPLD